MTHPAATPTLGNDDLVPDARREKSPDALQMKKPLSFEDLRAGGQVLFLQGERGVSLPGKSIHGLEGTFELPAMSAVQVMSAERTQKLFAETGTTEEMSVILRARVKVADPQKGREVPDFVDFTISGDQLAMLFSDSPFVPFDPEHPVYAMAKSPTTVAEAAHDRVEEVEVLG